MSLQTQRPEMAPNTELKTVIHQTVCKEKEESGGHGRTLVARNTKYSHIGKKTVLVFVAFFVHDDFQCPLGCVKEK